MQNGKRRSVEQRLAIRLRRLKQSMPPEVFARFMAADGTLKWCYICKKLNPVEEFHKNRSTFDGLAARCKACSAVIDSANHRERRDDPEYRERHRRCNAEWRAAMKAEGRAQAIAKQYHLKRYGLTPETFRAMLRAQRHCCAICKRLLTGARDTHVDHDHACCPGDRSCGQCVRGLLCSNCNTSLGGFRDDPAILRSAVRYLQRQQSPAATPDGYDQGVLWIAG